MFDPSRSSKDRRTAARGSLFHTRRRYPRLPLPLEATYESAERITVAARFDLSLRGIFVASKAPDPAGTRCVVRLDLPGRTALVRVDGVVVRSDSNGMAIRFTALREDERRAIAAFLVRRGGLSVLPQLDRGWKGWIRTSVNAR
jgi:hypothetical protein